MGGALNLRVASPDDAKDIATIYAPFVRDTAISFEVNPPDTNEMRRRITSTLVTHPWLVAVDADRIIGYAYASQHRTREAYRWACDVAVYLDAPNRGKGIGNLLYTELLRILSAQGYRGAYAGIALPNAASVALHEKMGFSHLGTYAKVGFKLGQWHDVGWWQRTLRTDDGEPVEVAPFERFID